MLSIWSKADRFEFISAGVPGYKRLWEKSDCYEVLLYRPLERKKKDVALYR